MLKRIILLLVIVTLSLIQAQYVPKDSLERMLEAAKNYYNSGEYEKAINELEKAQQFLKQLKQVDQVEAYKYLAFSYVAFGNNDKAKQTFKKALQLKPDLELDPATVSPKIIKVFEEAKAEMKTMPAKPPTITKPEKPLKPKKEISKFSKTSVIWRSCCFPGWGQLYRGESSKAKKLMILGGITGGFMVFSSIMRQIQHDEYVQVPPDNYEKMSEAYDKYKFWYNCSGISALGFFAIYFYNLYDAFFVNSDQKYSLLNGQRLQCEVSTEHFFIAYKINF